MSTSIRWILIAMCAVLSAISAPAVALDVDDAIGFERTPPRLSFTDGDVAFLRPGAEDWTPALVNTALAAGDALYTGNAANLELQVAARAYVRAGEHTQLGLASLEPDYLQLRVTTGHVSLDLRSRKPGQTFEFDTPNGAFTVERIGYYHIVVDGDTSVFTIRRGGRATLTLADGESVTIAASEQVIVTGDSLARVESYAAPELDAWDRWNYARTDDQIDAVSARYVPRDVYGVDDLDHYGDWRVVPTYGAIWVPRGIGRGWAPYTTGRWLWDPYYDWTWVDDAPWGWAPYHYGRWVRVSGYWGWSPGPIVARPYYAPALVAFYSGGVSVGVTLGTPSVGWVALGWGEPLVPWWGPARFRARPRWAGWGGPHVVNQVVVKVGTNISVNQIRSYQHARERDAFVSIDRRYFGRRGDERKHYQRGRPDDFRLVRDDHPVRPDRSSLVATRGRAVRPPRETQDRSVVATREARREPRPDFEGSPRNAKPAEEPAARIVRQRPDKSRPVAERAPFGKRGEAERRIPAPAPRFERSSDRAAGRVRDESRPQQPTPSERKGEPTRATPRAPAPDARRAAPSPKPNERPARAATPQRAAESAKAPEKRTQRSSGGGEQTDRTKGALPGEPANRVFRRAAKQQQRSASRPDADRSEREKQSNRSGDKR